jgi:outer membrane protein OmpA-like peptidoglycan-associated protein
MADLNVEPKTGRPWWIWLLIALAAIALIAFLARSCDDDNETTGVTDTEAVSSEPVATTESETTRDEDWNNLNRDIPAASYAEITDKDITVRGNDEYAIYSLDETILFGTDSKSIRPEAEQKLQQVAASLGQRFDGGRIRIYGFTDAKGSAGYNQQLAEDRADAVRNWLVKNGKISEDMISIHPVGEAQHVASNATAKGRQQNRRVEIVARQGNQAQ